MCAQPAYKRSLRTLAGTRVLDLTRVWAGPLATRMLADFGAQVVKVGDPRVAFDRSTGTFNKLNRSKTSLALRLDQPEGQDIFKMLVRVSDVVVENFRPRVMKNFDLTYDVLRAEKADLIMVSMPGFGTEGAYADYPAFGPSVEAMTGINILMGYPGGPPMGSAIAYPDPVAALNAAGAIMTALWHRRQTGRGQLIDLSLAEGPVCQIGEFLLASSHGKNPPARTGSSNPDHAPYGCYPAAGEDRWIAVCITTEAHWRSLCEVMGRPELREDPRFSSAAARCQHRQEVDALVAGWTSTQESDSLMEILQRRGIPAGAVLDARDMLRDPHLNERRFFAEITEPDIGLMRYPGQAIRMSAEPTADWKASPRLGEHSRGILGELLRLDERTIGVLEAKGIVGCWSAE